MTAIPKIIEGTWEEIQQHAPELAGHRLRITVLDTTPLPQHPDPADKSPEAVEAWIKHFEDWAYNRPEIPTDQVLDDSRDSIYNERTCL